jgi:hypothetical protein
MSNMPGDYSTYQNNLDSDTVMNDGDVLTHWWDEPNTSPTNILDPTGILDPSGGPNPNTYHPTDTLGPSGGPDPNVYHSNIRNIDMGENVWAQSDPRIEVEPGQSKRTRVVASSFRDDLQAVGPLTLHWT